MTRRLRTTLLALLGVGLVAPLSAGMLYVPVGLNESGATSIRNTELWVTNPSDAAVIGFYARFIPSLSDGTLIAGETPVYYVLPGQSLRFTDLVPQGGRGMIEIEGSPELIVTARLAPQAVGFDVDPEPVDVPVLGSKDLIPAGGAAWLQGFERAGTTRTSNLGVANLAHVANNCTVDVRQADGLLILQNVGFKLPPLSMAQFDDAFALLGLTNVAWGARVKVSCDQSFWAYNSVYDADSGAVQFGRPSVTPADSQLPKVEAPGGGGGGGGGEDPPVDPTAVVFSLPGNFLTCSGCGNWQYDMPFGSTRRFRKIVLDFDVWAKQWDSGRPNGFHCVFWLNNGSAWSNMMGYLNSKGTQGRMTFQVNWGVGREASQNPGMQLGTWYHVHYEYDMIEGAVWYEIRNGASVRVSGSYDTGADEVSTSKMFVQFGSQIAEGPESRTPGWKWSDLTAQFIP